MQSEIQVIRCPHCREYINARSAECRFCHGYIDTTTTQVAAELQQRVNAAYNEASWIRNIAGAYAIFVAIRLVLPFFAIGSGIVLPIMFVALPILLIRWYVRFGRLQTDDPDYPRAQRNWRIAFLVFLPVALIWLALVLIFGL